MPTVLRKFIDGSVVDQIEIVPDGWDLDQQVKQSHEWLESNTIEKLTDGFWALDIGFLKRKVARPGYTIPVEFMKILVDNDVTLWLSHYPDVE